MEAFTPVSWPFCFKNCPFILDKEVYLDTFSLTTKGLKPIISGSRLYLRPIEVADAHGPYLNWMNDPEITAMLESRFRRYSAEDLSEYILSTTTTGLNVFCAIILKETERHIGNIKMGPIHPYHLSGDIGLMIGEKDCWGKGYATEAIGLMCTYGFNELGLHKITAGAYDNNQGSVQAFIKVGFEIEGKRKSMYRVNDEWVDGILLGRLNPADRNLSEKSEANSNTQGQ